MSESEKKFSTWEEVIVDFFENRVSESKLYKAREYIQKKEADIEKEKDSKKIEKLTKSKNEKYSELISFRNNKDGISDWLDKTSNKNLKAGKKLIKATHVLKFSHSSAPPEGLMLKDRNSTPLLTTGVFNKHLVHDIAHSNGNLVTISRFFALDLNNYCILDLVLDNNFSFLDQFSKNQDQLNKWAAGLSNLVEEREIKTGDKTKQVYFPTTQTSQVNKDDYDLLIPLFSSSLCEEMYSSINNIKYGEEQIKVREQAKKEKDKDKPSKFHPEILINLLTMGVQKFGGAQPQNVSMLNKGRTWKADPRDKTAYGITYLFNSSAPVWETKISPPLYKNSLFNDLQSFTIKTETSYLCDFLIRFKQLDLSIKDPKRKRHLERWVNNIIDEFLFYIGTIQSLPAGWSSDAQIKLKKTHQYLLDPYRLDNTFQAERQNTDWKTDICKDFARWLNNQLRRREPQFTPQAEHTRLWKKLLEQPLLEYMEPIEQSIKQSVKETA